MVRRRTGCSAAVVGFPLFVKVAQPPGKPFHADQFDYIEVPLFEFATKLFRLVEVGRREPVGTVVGVAMLALGQVSLDDLPELQIEEKSRARPSKSEANRLIAATAIKPPGRTARTASRTCWPSSSVVKWYIDQRPERHRSCPRPR